MGEHTRHPRECDNQHTLAIFCQPHLDVWQSESNLGQGIMSSTDVLINRFNEREMDTEREGKRGKINNWVVTLCVQLEMHE